MVHDPAGGFMVLAETFLQQATRVSQQQRVSGKSLPTALARVPNNTGTLRLKMEL